MTKDQRQKRARRSALLLGLAALAIYLGYVGYFVITGGSGG